MCSRGQAEQCTHWASSSPHAKAGHTPRLPPRQGWPHSKAGHTPRLDGLGGSSPWCCNLPCLPATCHASLRLFTHASAGLGAPCRTAAGHAALLQGMPHRGSWSDSSTVSQVLGVTMEASDADIKKAYRPPTPPCPACPLLPCPVPACDANTGMAYWGVRLGPRHGCGQGVRRKALYTMLQHPTRIHPDIDKCHREKPAQCWQVWCSELW